MHVCRLQEVHSDFIKIGDGTDDVGADVLLVIEGLDAAPDPNISIICELYLLRVFWGVGVNPLFDINEASAIVEFVGYVGSLLGDIANLSDERDLSI